MIGRFPIIIKHRKERLEKMITALQMLDNEAYASQEEEIKQLSLMINHFYRPEEYEKIENGLNSLQEKINSLRNQKNVANVQRCFDQDELREQALPTSFVKVRWDSVSSLFFWRSKEPKLRTKALDIYQQTPPSPK